MHERISGVRISDGCEWNGLRTDEYHHAWDWIAVRCGGGVTSMLMDVADYFGSATVPLLGGTLTVELESGLWKATVHPTYYHYGTDKSDGQ